MCALLSAAFQLRVHGLACCACFQAYLVINNESLRQVAERLRARDMWEPCEQVSAKHIISSKPAAKAMRVHSAAKMRSLNHEWVCC